MSDMKCPFCQQELLLSSFRDGDEEHQMWGCLHCELSAYRKIWETLIRTRKALDVAKERLKNTILGAEVLATPEYLASRAKETLAEITALEQKDKR